MTTEALQGMEEQFVLEDPEMVPCRALSAV